MPMKWLEDFRTANWFKRLNRTLQVLLVLGLVAGLNILGTRHFTRVDISPGQRHTLSPESRDYVRQLEETITIVDTLTRGRAGESEMVTDVLHLLKAYEAAGSEGPGEPVIDVLPVNPFLERGEAAELAREYGIDELRADRLYVVSKSGIQEILPEEIFESRMDEGEVIPVSFRGERVLTGAIIDVIRAERPKLYFTVGHGEMRLRGVDPLRGLSQLAGILRTRNFELAEVDLSRDGGVPDDADCVVLAAPQGPVRAEEVEKLRTYLSERSGRLLVWIEPLREHGLGELLLDWGLATPDMVVLDTGRDYQSASGDLLIRAYGEHPVTETLRENELTTVLGLARPVRPEPARASGDRFTQTPLLLSSPTSWADLDYRQVNNLQFNEGVDLRGPISVAALSERRSASQLGIDIPGGRLAVFGNAELFANQRIHNLGNFTLLLETLHWCLERDSLLTIPERPMERYQLSLSGPELMRVGLTLATVPAAVALFGLIVFWIRRT